MITYLTAVLSLIAAFLFGMAFLREKRNVHDLEETVKSRNNEINRLRQEINDIGWEIKSTRALTANSALILRQNGLLRDMYMRETGTDPMELLNSIPEKPIAEIASHIDRLLSDMKITTKTMQEIPKAEYVYCDPNSQTTFTFKIPETYLQSS